MKNIVLKSLMMKFEVNLLFICFCKQVFHSKKQFVSVKCKDFANKQKKLFLILQKLYLQVQNENRCVLNIACYCGV